MRLVANTQGVSFLVNIQLKSIDKCINITLNQYFNKGILQDFYDKMKIKSVKIDMNQQSIFNNANSIKEISPLTKYS